MSRYSNDETLKIEYFKSKIREIRYLEYELISSQSKINEIDCRLNVISSSKLYAINNKQNYYACKLDSKWNKLIQEKDRLNHKINIINKELNRTDLILDSLSPNIKKIAIDLLVRKYSLEKIKDKYFVSNPYQSLNDELRYLEIDNF